MILFQDDEADAQAEALEVAWQACEVWTDFSDDDPDYGTQDYHFDRAMAASNAHGLASQAAYLDPRWRTLADAFPYVHLMQLLLQSDAGLSEEGDSLKAELRDQAILWETYESVAYNECDAVYVLRGERESYYDEYFVDPEGDPDTE